MKHNIYTTPQMWVISMGTDAQLMAGSTDENYVRRPADDIVFPADADYSVGKEIWKDGDEETEM